MSFFQTQNVDCPACGTPIEFDVVYSVNAVLRNDLRNQILNRTFQRRTCESCGNDFRMDPEFTYLDAKRKQWLLVRPFADLNTWQEMEEYATSFFQAAFGPNAPRASQRLGQGMKAKVTFGWPAVREKLVCVDNAIDDVELELTKFALLRNSDICPLSDTTECRLIGVNNDQLILAWTDVDTEAVIEALQAPKGLYDEIAADESGWSELRAQVSAGPFVDMRKLLVPAA